MKAIVHTVLLAAGLTSGSAGGTPFSMEDPSPPLVEVVWLDRVTGSADFPGSPFAGDGRSVRPAIEFTQNFDPPWGRSMGDAPPLLPPPGFPAFGSPVGPRLDAQRSCADGIDRQVGFAGYIKSKLQLTAQQTDAWRKIEDAIAPALVALRALCRELPDGSEAASVQLPELVDITERQMTARAAVLRAMRDPMRQFYEMLSPEQRAGMIPPGHSTRTW
jgi:hypothetical protein